MAETRYPLGKDKVVRFGYDDYRYGCLCTFPFNYTEHKFGIKTVESLALLGASLCLFRNGGLQEVKYASSDEYIIPDCLPEWIRDEIRRNVGDYSERFDSSEYDEEFLPDDATENDRKQLLLKRFQGIKEWAEKSIKEIEDGTFFEGGD